jgi:hypothetical protein
MPLLNIGLILFFKDQETREVLLQGRYGMDFIHYRHLPCLLLATMLMVWPNLPHHCGTGV